MRDIEGISSGGEGDPPSTKISRGTEALGFGNRIFRENFTLSDIQGPRRWRELVNVRHAACWHLRVSGRWSLPSIGYFMGNRDHATVMYGIGRINRRLGLERNFPFNLWQEEKQAAACDVDRMNDLLQKGLRVDEVAHVMRIATSTVYLALRGSMFDRGGNAKEVFNAPDDLVDQILQADLQARTRAIAAAEEAFASDHERAKAAKEEFYYRSGAL